LRPPPAARADSAGPGRCADPRRFGHLLHSSVGVGPGSAPPARLLVHPRQALRRPRAHGPAAVGPAAGVLVRLDGPEPRDPVTAEVIGTTAVRPLEPARPLEAVALTSQVDVWDDFVARAPQSSFCHWSGWRKVMEDVLGHETR